MQYGSTCFFLILQKNLTMFILIKNCSIFKQHISSNDLKFEPSKCITCCRPLA
jgi:hypothetical protein